MATLPSFSIQQKLHKFIHNNFGLIPYRERLKVRKDAFFQLIPNDESQQDNELMRRLSRTIVKLSQLCSKQCVEMRYSMWTREEKACVKECTKRYFEGYRQIVRYTNQQVGQDV